MNNNDETTKNATELTKFCLGILNDENVKSEIKNFIIRLGVWRSGSASALHAEGHGFDPHLLQLLVL